MEMKDEFLFKTNMLDKNGEKTGVDQIADYMFRADMIYRMKLASDMGLPVLTLIARELEEKFDENFKAYGWEDAELAYQLWKHHDMKLFYEPDAKAYHHHHIPELNLSKRMRTVGKSAVYFKKRHPEAWVVPTGFKRLFIKIATNPITLPLTRLLGKNTYFKFKSWREFMKGSEISPRESK